MLQQHADDRSAWIADHAHGAARCAAITAELDRRTKRVARVASIQPSAYLVVTLGPVPERPSQRRAWERAARRIEMYRSDFAVRDPQRALGPEPHELRQRSAWRDARREIDRAGREIAQIATSERSLGNWLTR